MFPPREPPKGDSPGPNRVQKNVGSTCNRFGSVAFSLYGASTSPQAMRSDSTAMVPRCRGCFLFSRAPPDHAETAHTRDIAGPSSLIEDAPLGGWAAMEYTRVDEAQISLRSSQFWAARLFDRRTRPDLSRP
jgi:hypothetical protein